MNEVAIITASCGGYDHIRTSKVCPDADYLYFTCEPQLVPSAEWRKVMLPDMGHLDFRRQAKLAKLNPHAIPELRDYRYVIWIDGDMEIRNIRFKDEILSYMKNGFVISPHFEAVPGGRHCAYGEATIRPEKYQKEPLDQQVAYYRRMGFPENYGLYEGGVAARDMHNKDVENLGVLWMQQNLLWSYQDQVSLPYCLWKTGFEPDVLPKSFRQFGWVHINAHTRDD